MEHLLTDLLFIQRGKLVLDIAMEAVPERYAQLVTNAEQAAAARALQPLHEQQALGRHAFIFEDADRKALSALGELRTPGVADLFVAKLKGGQA